MALRKHALLTIVSLVVLSLAGVRPLMAEQPGDGAGRTALKKEISMLNIPIEVSANEFAGVLNQTISKELYKGATKTSGLGADVVRNGPIMVSASDNYLYITLPVTMSLSYGGFETRAIPLKLKFKATAGITPDWRLRTEIYYQGVSDLFSEEIGIGLLSFKPRRIVEGITQPVQKLLSGLVSKKLNTMLPLKERIADVWNSTQKPILLDKNYSAWLKLSPREIMLYPLYAQNNRIRLSVGINTYAEMVVGPEPAASPLQPLPNLKMNSAFDKTFRIDLNADLFYKDLRAIATTALINKRVDSDGKTIVIKDLDLYGSGDKLVVKLETRGSLEGAFNLTAKPVFDPETNVFSVEDVDFDMQTKSLLLQSADWFLHSAIRSIIQAKLNMNLTQQLEQSRQMAGKALAHVTLAEHVFLKGDVKNLKFRDVIVQQDKLSIQVCAEGESGIYFQ